MSKNIVSIATTWIIRILLFFIVMFGLGLAMLSVIGGTSESHRKGLEQAFSDFLKADVTVGEINEFNILPQMSIKASNVRGVFHDSGKEFMVDRIDFAFGFSDIFFGKRKIEEFKMENFRFSKDSKIDLKIDDANIGGTEKPELTVRGEYSHKKFDAAVPTNKEGSSRPVYSFSDKNPITGHFDTLEFQGVLDAGTKKEKIFDNMQITAGGHLIATAHGKHDAGKNFVVVIECMSDKAIPASAREDLNMLAGSGFVELSGSCK